MPKIPDIVEGRSMPDGIQELRMKEKRKKHELRQQRMHDYLIATYGIVGGLISGVISSLIVLWLQGLL